MAFKFRALCFHGFRTNSEILNYQTKKLQSALPDFEFVFLDGFVQATGPAETAVTEFWPGAPVYQWWDAQEDGATMKYNKAEVSIQRTLQYISENGPFDVLIGFSHGANFITMLTAHCEMLTGGNTTCMPFKTVMLFCSGGNSPDQRTFDPVRDGMLVDNAVGCKPTGVLRTSSVHVIGKKDSIAAAGLSLAGAYTSGSTSSNIGGDRAAYRAVIEGSWGHDFPPVPFKAKRGPRARVTPITMVVSTGCGGSGKEAAVGDFQDDTVEGDPYNVIRSCLYEALSHHATGSKSLAPGPNQKGLQEAPESSRLCPPAPPPFMMRLIEEGGGYLQAKGQLQDRFMRPLVATEKAWLTSQIRALSRG